MIASITSGSGFGGCVGYCMSGGGERKKLAPEAAGEPEETKADRPAGKRVLWSETRHLATNDPRRAARMMEATARDAAILKKLAGEHAGGRKLKKPVVHYSLSWAKDERPSRREMREAADSSRRELALSGHQAVIVAHGDTKHAHVHVIVNRVEPWSGLAANMYRSKLTLSKWAERWERAQGKIRCERRVRNNAARDRGAAVRGTGESKARHYRARPGIRRQRKAADPERIGQVAWWRAEERTRWRQATKDHTQAVGRLEATHRTAWREIYQRHQGEAQAQDKACRSVLGRLRTWRSHGGRAGEIGEALTGRGEALERWRRSMEARQRMERTLLAQAHLGQVREIDEGTEKTYRAGLQGADQRAERAARHSGWGSGDNLNVDSERGRDWVDQEQIEQRRELYGGPSYEQVLKERAERTAEFEARWEAEAPERARARERERSRGRGSGPSR